MMAMASRKIFTSLGKCLASIAKTARAKAMSVAAGMA
jgi:hypothetical protein